MEKVTWSKRMIAAAVMSIATPIVTVFMTGYYTEEGGYLIGIPMAIVSYLLINGWTALLYALSRAFRIFTSHLTFSGFSLVGLLITIFFVLMGFAIGMIYFVCCPIVMLFMHYSELMGEAVEPETIDEVSETNE